MPLERLGGSLRRLARGDDAYSDAPSSSRTSTSTSTSSAAAFSLRSLSNRDSVGSTGSSSAPSSVRRRTLDELDVIATLPESDGIDGIDGMDSINSSPGTRHASVNATESSSSLATETDHAGQGRSSPDTFRMHRIQSIGRGYDVRKRQSLARAAEEDQDQEDTVSTNAADPPTPVADLRDDDADDTIISLTRSPRKFTRNLDSGEFRVPLSSSPRLAVLPSLKTRIDALSLTAAAQASPQDAPQEGPGFMPPEPRRHTGSYALRSRSALSKQLGGNLNFGNGQGRAAARKELARTTVVDCAPAEASAPSPMTGGRMELTPDDNTTVFFGSPLLPSNDENMLGVQSGGSRPPISRSSTSLASVNVLRTPTTEEWSRYLVKQGFDPLLIAPATGLTGAGSRTTRSRSNTGRSVPGGKRRISERETSKVASLDTQYERSQLAETSTSASDVARARASLSSSIRGVAEDLSSLDEEGQHDFDVEDSEEVYGRVSDDDDEMLRNSDEEVESDDISEDDAGDSLMDERMRALHEVLSRPPSRLGTPAPSESGRGGVRVRSSSDALRLQLETSRRGPNRWPTRDTAAILTGYPLPPSGEQRSINDFVIVDDIGRGAYGLVKKARVRDERTGEPTGPEFCIKYIIKSRILADCWRRHKVLGPIPVEIHVLDQLRRLPYQMPTESPAWSPEILFAAHAPPPPPTPKTAVAALADESIDGDVTVGHPSLCMMVDFFEDHEFYYMVMPCFGTGQDLFDYVESQPHGLTTKQVRCILGQLADGLRFLHNNNVVHRDVKDENVILDGKGHIQLIDFGSAAHINIRNGSRLFDTFSGTLDYAAAEILRGEKYGGKEQDVWALGVVTYVLLCGDCPFWNGEEAMEGLREGTRAHSVLVERCHAAAVAAEGSGGGSAISLGSIARANAIVVRDAVTFGLDGFTGEPIQSTQTSSAPTTDADYLRRQRDFLGQPDGGGRLHDAADLILRCVDLDLTARPTMDQICHHRFLLGDKGWHGHMGWQ